jgi:hypothetical protein
MNIEEAKVLVEEKIQSERNGYAVVDDSTIEYESCWVLFYQTKKYVETNDFRDTIVGHGPVIVDKQSKSIYELGSGNDLDECINAFNKCGDPFATITAYIEVSGWKTGARKVPATGHIKFASELGLKDAKYVIDQALENIPAVFQARDLDIAEQTVTVLSNYGFTCRQLWSNQC